jgi:hypothetical protein
MKNNLVQSILSQAGYFSGPLLSAWRRRKRRDSTHQILTQLKLHHLGSLELLLQDGAYLVGVGLGSRSRDGASSMAGPAKTIAPAALEMV